MKPPIRFANSVFSCTATLAILATFATLPCAAQQPASSGAKQAIGDLLAQLYKTISPRQTAISPDGSTVAWVALGRIHLTQLGDGKRDRVVSVGGTISRDTHDTSSHSESGKQKCSENDIAWSPNGRQLAFLSDCATPDQAQVFVVEAADNAVPRELTHLKGYLHDLAWSPDGKQIGFLFVENATRVAGALAAMKPAVGVISAKTIAEVQRVEIVNAAAGSTSEATPANLHVYEFDWSPDSQSLAYVAAAPPGEDNWWVAQLYTQAVNGGAPHSILKPDMQIAVPRWSPDGRQIAFIGGLMSDQGATGGDVYLVPAIGGAPKDLTPGRKSSPAWLHWISPQELAFTEIVDGQARYAAISVPDGKEYLAARVTFPGSIGAGGDELSLSFARDNIAALIKSSYAQPPEVWAGPLNNLRQITHLNSALRTDWGAAKNLTWTNQGFRVQGWLLYPKNYDANKKYPLIVYVHGGPASAVLPCWPEAGYSPVAFSAMGYFVLMPNPRGSYGEGEAFTAANRKDFGYGDLRDILAGVDTVTKDFAVDSTRVGLTGWSYGGFMSMFAVTQTDRFRAAVAGAGISDWKSYYGENSIDQWMIPYFGASVYDDPGVYAKSSAINYIRNAKTPTLIVVGDRDGECPAPQSFEFWHALRTMDVPVKLVVYANEGHGFTNPADSRDVLVRAIDWFEQYMPANVPSKATAGR